MIITNDIRDLCCAVRAHPDEDAPRLMLADAVQEAGDDSRAELIRIQVELAKATLRLHSGKCRRNELMKLTKIQQKCWKREKALLREHGQRWRTGPKCESCCGKGGWKRIGEVGLPMLDPQCPACWGTGDAGGLMGHVEHQPHDNHKVPVEYHRGMKRVVTLLNECATGLPETSTDNEPTAWLSAICECHADVAEVWLQDREPYLVNSRGDWMFQYWQPTNPPMFDRNYNLPWPVVKLMGDLNQHCHSDSTSKRHLNLYYRTSTLARQTLARAVALWGHGERPTQ